MLIWCLARPRRSGCRPTTSRGRRWRPNRQHGDRQNAHRMFWVAAGVRHTNRRRPGRRSRSSRVTVVPGSWAARYDQITVWSAGGGDVEAWPAAGGRDPRCRRGSGGLRRGPVAGSGNSQFRSVSGEDGVGVPAAHGDDDIGSLHDLVGPGFGEFAGDVDANLGHRRDGGGVDLVARLGPPDQATARSPARWVKNPRPLGAAGVVRAEKQHGGFGRPRFCLRLGPGRAGAGGRNVRPAAQQVGNGCPPANWS